MAQLKSLKVDRFPSQSDELSCVRVCVSMVACPLPCRRRAIAGPSPCRPPDSVDEQCFRFSDCASCTANTWGCQWCEDRKCISASSNCTVVSSRRESGRLFFFFFLSFPMGVPAVPVASERNPAPGRREDGRPLESEGLSSAEHAGVVRRKEPKLIISVF